MTDPVVIPLLRIKSASCWRNGYQGHRWERILNTDYHDPWENVANYKGAAVDVTDGRVLITDGL